MKRGNTKYRLLDRWVGIPILSAMALCARRRGLPHQIARIGILVAPTMGDTLITSAAVQDIKRHYPDARLICFASSGSLPAARLLPCIDQIATIKITSPLKSIRIIRDATVDLLLDFTPWQRITAFYSAFSGAKCRVGFRSMNQHRHFHYDIVVDHSRHVHESENFRRLIRAAGITPFAVPRVNVPNERPHGLPDSSNLIVFHPWAAGERAALRQWPEAHWIELATRLNAEETLFVVTGAPSELSKSHELCQALKNHGLRAVAYESSDGLVSLAAMLKSADLVVSVNTGVLHLAAIVGAPTIALNGPTATHRWGPVGPRVASIEPHGGGGGFLHFGFEFAGHPTDTMSRIRVDDVFNKAAELMPLSLRFSQNA